MELLNLTLKSSKSTLDNLIQYEYIDVEVLDKLINSNLLKNNNKYDKIYNNERDQLLSYKENIINGQAKVQYNKVKNMLYGRVNPLKSLSLFTMRKEIRHTLAKNNYVDIDIVNCHPVLLLQVCQKNNIDTDYLHEYVTDRAKHINDVSTHYNVTTDEAKNLFIQLLYFGTFESWAEELKLINVQPTKFIKFFKKEIQEIGLMIESNNKEIDQLIKKRKKTQNIENYNKTGSIVSYFLQEIEHKILELIYNYCSTNNIINNDCVLCADGIMIKIDKYDDNLLLKFSEIVKKEYGFDITFIKKEMDKDYLKILDNSLLNETELKSELLQNYKFKNYDLKKDFSIITMNTLFFEDIKSIGEEKYIKYFHLTNSFNYFNSYHAEFYLSNTIYKLFNNSIEPYKNFENTFKHLYLNFNKQNKRFTALYMESSYKKIYSSFAFQPNKKVLDDKYNLFHGFIYENNTTNYDQEIVDLYLNHIKYLSKNDDKVADYLINWFSHIIQKPEYKSNVAVVLYSQTEGVGKNILTDIFSKLLTGYTGKFKDTKSITDRFNGDLMGKIFMVSDEIDARAKEIQNELKDIITRKTETIEFKGKDKIHDMEDYKNYLFTTNNETSFKISNSDRRFMFIECPEEKQTNDYYTKLFNILENEDNLRSIFNYLKTRDIKLFNPRDIVITEYKQELTRANLPAYIRFIKDNFNLYANETILTKDLYKHSVEYGKKNKLPSSFTERYFYINFKKVFGKFNTEKEFEGKRQSCYCFPDDLEMIFDDLINKNYITNK